MPKAIHVLVVDDDPVDLELTRRLLTSSTRMHFTMETASHLRQAIQMLRSGKHDVLLLDLNLPGSHGLATLDVVRAETGELPIVVVSGHSDEETALRSLDHGAQDYLIKGNVTSEMLVNAMRYAIQRQQLLQEITNAKELLEKKNQRLAELYQTAHRFVDNVSHEFRTPLTVIKEFTSLIRDGLAGAVTDEQRRFLDIVGDRADDLNTMVDDMLDVSKLEAGLLGAWRRSCKVSDIVRSVLSALERKAAVKGVTLDIDVSDELPLVYCDDEKIGRVMINLAVNAIKFCHEGGHVRIWATENPKAPGALIGVTDNGPGIDQEHLTAIFERFRQLQTGGHNSTKGFGLGLSIAKELVDLNFGEMSVESVVRQGTTFTFTLPPAEPMEVMRRYLHRIMHLRNGSSKVTLITASIGETTDAAGAEDIDAYMQSFLRRNDLVFRIQEHRWLMVLALTELELDKFQANAKQALNEINRNRIQGPLPEVAMQTVGTWRPLNDFNEVFSRLRELLSTGELVHV